MKWRDMKEEGESEREAQLRKKILNQSKKFCWSPTLLWFAGFRGPFRLIFRHVRRPVIPP